MINRPQIDAPEALESARVRSLPWSRQALLLVVAAWTVFVAISLYVLMRGEPPPSVVIVQEEDRLGATRQDRFFALFRADVGFERL